MDTLSRAFSFRRLLAAGSGCLLAAALPAQTPAPAPAPAAASLAPATEAAPAGAPAIPQVNHDFDFWIGEWIVSTPDGKLAGMSRVEAVSNGFALLENWTGSAASGGGGGKSFNTYNPYKKQWQQLWAGSNGGVLELAGNLDSKGRMVLSGSRPAPDGRTMTSRITWSHLTDGTVHQDWEISYDGGKTWEMAFQGVYRRQ